SRVAGAREGSFPIPEVSCLGCGESIEKSRHRGRPKKWCNSCRETRKSDQRRAARRRKHTGMSRDVYLASLPVTTSKKCRTCGETKPSGESDGSWNDRKVGGRRFSAQPSCKPCARAIARQRRAGSPVVADRAERARLKALGLKACTKCGETKPLSAFRLEP